MTAYERICLLVPLFYRDVFEMDSIYRIHGEQIDGLLSSFDRVKLNSYILSADEETTEKMEKFLGIKVYPSKSLDERRRFVAAYYAGFGKISKTKIKEIMWSFTGASCSVELKGYSSSGDEALYIILERGKYDTINVEDIQRILRDRIPAHVMVICAIIYNCGELNSSKITYGYLSAFTYKQIKTGIPLEEVQ